MERVLAVRPAQASRELPPRNVGGAVDPLVVMGRLVAIYPDPAYNASIDNSGPLASASRFWARALLQSQCRALL